MADLKSKLENCRANLCDAELDLMDFVEGSGYIEPTESNLLIIYNIITSLINSIDCLC